MIRVWKLVGVTQTHSENYRTAEEYERRNLQYSLSRAGQAAFAGVTHALGVLAATGALQAAVLHAISDKLGALVHYAESGTDRQVSVALAELEEHLESRRVNTTSRRWIEADMRTPAPVGPSRHQRRAST